MQKETPHARASLLAAADEGVRRHARGGRAPQFLKRLNEACPVFAADAGQVNPELRRRAHPHVATTVQSSDQIPADDRSKMKAPPGGVSRWKDSRFFPFENSSSGDKLSAWFGPSGSDADGLCHREVL